MSKKDEPITFKTGQTFKSFAELGVAYGIKPVVKQTRDQDKLAKQREKFCSKHICPACKTPMEYLPESNIMVCKNEKCKGVKVEKVDPLTGETRINYLTSYHTLDEKGSEIAANIFAEAV